MPNHLILICLFIPLFPVSMAGAGMNPGNKGFPVIQLFDNVYSNNGYSALCTKCHERNPSLTSADNTAIGSHFVFGGDAVRTNSTISEKLDAWPSGQLSKYGQIGTRNSVTGEVGELICESCHNMKVYTGKARLLVADNTMTDPSPLCEGCHARTGAGHHILTGETSFIFNRPLSNAPGAFVRNPPTAGSGASYPGPDKLNCRSCHKPHDAQTQTGARILIRGYRGAGTATPGSAVLGIGTTGMERQGDIAGSPANRLVTDFSPLCDSCHTASD